MAALHFAFRVYKYHEKVLFLRSIFYLRVYTPNIEPKMYFSAFVAPSTCPLFSPYHEYSAYLSI